MKKLVQLLFILSCISYTYADCPPEDHKKKECCLSPYTDQDFNFKAECCPGPRGKRGHRGPVGPTGATGATGPASSSIGEIWMNATQLAGCGEGPLYPTIYAVYPYGGCTSIPVWNLPNPNIDQIGGWGAFNIPANLDNTMPVTVIVHILVPSIDGAPIGNTAALEVAMAYLSNNEIGGPSGFTDTQFSADFTVTPPDIISDANVRQLAIPVSLNPALITPGDWAFIAVVRTPATSNEYEGGASEEGLGIIWLSTISIQYSVIPS